MLNINDAVTFFGWCTIINLVFLSFSSILLIVMKNSISKIHSQLFNLHQDDVHKAYFQYLGNYKIAIIVFNLTPYIALKILSGL